MKRKMWNRILSIFIAAALMVSALPMNAVAEGNETFVEEVDEIGRASCRERV